jgi:hypothetical protein
MIRGGAVPVPFAGAGQRFKQEPLVPRLARGHAQGADLGGEHFDRVSPASARSMNGPGGRGRPCRHQPGPATAMGTTGAASACLPAVWCADCPEASWPASGALVLDGFSRATLAGSSGAFQASFVFAEG